MHARAVLLPVPLIYVNEILYSCLVMYIFLETLSFTPDKCIDKILIGPPIAWLFGLTFHSLVDYVHTCIIQVRAQLIQDLSAYKPYEELGVQQTRVLLLGPVGAGKSSFFNTISSVFRGRVTSQAGSGSAQHSVTTSVSYNVWHVVATSIILLYITRVNGVFIFLINLWCVSYSLELIN